MRNLLLLAAAGLGLASCAHAGPMHSAVTLPPSGQSPSSGPTTPSAGINLPGSAVQLPQDTTGQASTNAAGNIGGVGVNIPGALVPTNPTGGMAPSMAPQNNGAGLLRVPGQNPVVVPGGAGGAPPN